MAATQPGRLAVVGLGPGSPGLMAPDARAELDRAQDIVGYATYVQLAGAFRPDQTLRQLLAASLAVASPSLCARARYPS